MTSLVVRVGLLLAVLAALVAAALTVDLPDVTVIRAWIMSFGALAPVAFVTAYALVVPRPDPQGRAHRRRRGGLRRLAGDPPGGRRGHGRAVLAFVLARVLGRDAVERMTHGHLDRVDAAVERHGVLAALLVRLVPVLPFTVLNYACGVTAMRLRHYVVGTAVGLIPGTSAMVVLGSSGARVSLWVPAIVPVALGVLSLAGGAVWHYRSRRSRTATELSRSVGVPP